MRRAARRLLLALPSILAAEPAAALDTRLLPEHPTYARNRACTETAVALSARQGTHPLDGRFSPDPALSPMSQGDSAICFAYATADMISQRVGVTVSGATRRSCAARSTA